MSTDLRQNRAHAVRATRRATADVLAVGLSFASMLLMTLVAGSPPAAGPNRGPGVSNHPVNVVPSAAVAVPADWPVRPDGAITCLTCHSASPGLDSDGKVNLRGGEQSAMAFCANCHGNATEQSASGMHWLAVQRAHVMPEAARTFSTTGSIDRSSADCLSCHDGVSAKETGYLAAGAHGSGDYADPRRNHPIGTRYPRMGTTRVEVPLRPAAMLPATIQLPGGAVSCISCHDLYNTEASRLSVPITGSRLCLTCHSMD